MVKKVEQIYSLISQGRIKNAISEFLRMLNSEDMDDMKSELISLSARFNKNEKQKRINTICEADYKLEWNRILTAITSLMQEYQISTVQSAPINIDKLNNSSRIVFISYNHKDQGIALNLKDAIKSNGIGVIIDSESMRVGDDIKAFIEESVARSTVILSIVSNASLLSGWVGMETINTFFNIAINKDKKFIACYLEDDFFKKEYTLKAVDKIDKDISVIEDLMSEYSERKLDTGDLNTEKTRLYNLRNNMDKIIGRLRDSLCIDIRGEKLDKNLPKILEAIKHYSP